MYTTISRDPSSEFYHPHAIARAKTAAKSRNRTVNGLTIPGHPGCAMRSPSTTLSTVPIGKPVGLNSLPARGRHATQCNAERSSRLLGPREDFAQTALEANTLEAAMSIAVGTAGLGRRPGDISAPLSHAAMGWLVARAVRAQCRQTHSFESQLGPLGYALISAWYPALRDSMLLRSRVSHSSRGGTHGTRHSHRR
jgi:hypothetical protein